MVPLHLRIELDDWMIEVARALASFEATVVDEATVVAERAKR